MLLYPLGRSVALLAYPSSLRSTESTTDFSQPDYTATSDTCLAGWFAGTDGSLLIAAFVLSVLAAGFVGYRLPPSHNRLSAALSSLLAVGAVVLSFAHGP
ncbi:hypothetical protein D3C81_2101710 [compost metagenome]